MSQYKCYNIIYMNPFMNYNFGTKNLTLNENENENENIKKIKKLNNSLVAVLVYFFQGADLKCKSKVGSIVFFFFCS